MELKVILPASEIYSYSVVSKKYDRKETKYSLQKVDGFEEFYYIFKIDEKEKKNKRFEKITPNTELIWISTEKTQLQRLKDKLNK